MRLWFPFALSVALAACIDPGDPGTDPPPMCETSADCDSGEVCDEGVCWGNPPDTSQFAVKLEPPEELAASLVVTELPILSIAQDGTIRDLAFSDFVTIDGRVILACPVETCEDVSISATITVRRPSRFVGGPTFARNINATAGQGPGQAAFELRLPVTQPGEPPYEITIIPATDANAASGQSPAALAPPVRFTLEAIEDRSDQEWVIGDPAQHKEVTGRVVDAAGRGFANMQVSALGRWAQGDPLEKASSVAVTDSNGDFSLRIPVAMMDLYEIIAAPQPGVLAPTLRKRNVYIADPASTSDPVALEAPLTMPSYAEPISFVLPVVGYDGSGNQEDVVGAEVTLVTVLLEETDTIASFTSRAVTDGKGKAILSLIPGGISTQRVYIASVTPPAGSLHASLFEYSVQVGTGNPVDPAYLPGLVLPRRVAVKGKLLSARGTPVANATVSARVSLAFKWQLPLVLQTALDNLQFDETTTDANGKFLLWLDPQLVGQTPKYDLVFAPPVASGVPWWSKEAVTVEANTELGALELGDIDLPAASFARGPILDLDGFAVPGAKLRLYQLAADHSVCEGAILPFSVSECEAPATLRGIWQADDDGTVRIVLPER